MVKLTKELGWETIGERAKYLGITLFHKIHRNETRPLIKSNMQPWETGQKNTRSGSTYLLFRFKALNTIIHISHISPDNGTFSVKNRIALTYQTLRPK